LRRSTNKRPTLSSNQANDAQRGRRSLAWLAAAAAAAAAALSSTRFGIDLRGCGHRWGPQGRLASIFFGEEYVSILFFTLYHFYHSLPHFTNLFHFFNYFLLFFTSSSWRDEKSVPRECPRLLLFRSDTIGVRGLDY
jgi:hypothetical protein